MTSILLRNIIARGRKGRPLILLQVFEKHTRSITENKTPFPLI